MDLRGGEINISGSNKWKVNYSRCRLQTVEGFLLLCSEPQHVYYFTFSVIFLPPATVSYFSGRSEEGVGLALFMTAVINPAHVAASKSLVARIICRGLQRLTADTDVLHSNLLPTEIRVGGSNLTGARVSFRQQRGRLAGWTGFNYQTSLGGKLLGTCKITSHVPLQPVTTFAIKS